MKTHRTVQAKIVRHAEGLGVPTADLVRQRAFEIARIDGRHAFNDQDWNQAKVELHGSGVPDGDDGEDEMQFASVHDMVPGSMGHHTLNQPPYDAQNIVAELVSEGMDEAVHDQMLEASKLEDPR
ncbi:MAG: hypothetical protein WCD79_00695 [Chthoniobacteraceae bacterium]